MISVRIIAYSQPVIEGLKTSEDLVAYCARVSNPSNQHNIDTGPKLLNYLIKNKHWSPFEMVSACVEVNTTRDIARQILRHRSFSFQEFSQRYASPSADDFITDREARLQDAKNRQNSIDVDDPHLQEKFTARQKTVVHFALENYNWALDQGIAKEQARVFLPEGLTPSRLYMNGTLRSWIHYYETRHDRKTTQKEHVLLAEAVWPQFCEVYPFLKGFEAHQQ